MWLFSQMSATAPGWGVAIRETAAVVYACARLPRRWKRKLVTEQIKDVLMDIEQQVHQRPAFLMPPRGSLLWRRRAFRSGSSKRDGVACSAVWCSTIF